jgi:hypothetical protein
MRAVPCWSYEVDLNYKTKSARPGVAQGSTFLNLSARTVARPDL